ncbi:hypothetical protein ABIE91_001107 [Bradyrhizobium elkanii]|nr:hypothetical protein [Bradyrhizobium elkanii]
MILGSIPLAACSVVVCQLLMRADWSALRYASDGGRLA